MNSQARKRLLAILFLFGVAEGTFNSVTIEPKIALAGLNQKVNCSYTSVDPANCSFHCGSTIQTKPNFQAGDMSKNIYRCILDLDNGFNEREECNCTVHYKNDKDVSAAFTIYPPIREKKGPFFVMAGETKSQQIHAPYTYNLSCVFGNQSESIVNPDFGDCKLQIENAGDSDAGPRIFWICPYDTTKSDLKGCMKGKVEVVVVHANLNTKKHTLTLTTVGQFNRDNLHFSCVKGCPGKKPVANQADDAALTWRDVSNEVLLLVYDGLTNETLLNETITADQNQSSDNPNPIIFIPASLGVFVVLGVVVVVVVLLYRKKRLPCQNNGENNADNGLNDSGIPLTDRDRQNNGAEGLDESGAGGLDVSGTPLKEQGKQENGRTDAV